VKEDDDDRSREELFVHDKEEDSSEYADDSANDDAASDDPKAVEEDEDGNSEEYDNGVKEVINVTSTDHWADKYKKMKKHNKYFTIGYNEFMWSKFEEVNKCEYYLCIIASVNFVYFIDQSDLSLDFVVEESDL
jgi:hypothetical protein